MDGFSQIDHFTNLLQSIINVYTPEFYTISLHIYKLSKIYPEICLKDLLHLGY